MLIQINNETIEIDDDKTQKDELWGIINVIVAKKNTVLGYLIIDGKPVYKDFDNYFTENPETIDNIEIITDPLKALINDNFSTVYKYLTNAIPQVNIIADEFYRQPNENTWMKLIDLFEGIQWIIESVIKIGKIEDIENSILDYGIWNQYVQSVGELSEMIKELESPMVNKDHVLIGDLLIYEIIPVFQKIYGTIGLLVTTEGSENVS
nr:hypothetical protein [uncultured Acetobacterium sp.]